MRNGVLLLELLQVVARRDLAELAVLLEQLVDLGLVGLLVDLVSAVELLDVVEHS